MKFGGFLIWRKDVKCLQVTLGLGVVRGFENRPTGTAAD